jgi:hypothetical protein
LTKDDALFRFRVRSLALAQEMGNVRAACRVMAIHRSTYYRWRQESDRFGLEILRPRERRRPRIANSTSPMLELRVLAFAPAYPGCGPVRISSELRGRSGAASSCRLTGSGGCCGATVLGPEPSAWAWSPATPLRLSPNDPNPRSVRTPQREPRSAAARRTTQ